MIIPYTSSYRKECIDIFFELYKDDKYKYDWLNEQNLNKYFRDMEVTPKFKGYIYIDNSIIKGVCLGMINDYFSINKYYIKEIFVKKEFQGLAIGTDMIKNLTKQLKSLDIKIIEIQTNSTIESFNFYLKNDFKTVNNIVHMIKIL